MPTQRHMLTFKRDDSSSTAGPCTDAFSIKLEALPLQTKKKVFNEI